MLFVAAISPQSNNSSDCDIKSLKKEGVSKLNPYYYSASKVTSIKYTDTTQIIEVQVPLFKGEKYRMLFNTKALPKDIKIEIYDKDGSTANRNAVFTTKTGKDDIVVYEPDKIKKHYVTYVIPEGTNVESGCMVFMLGYQLTFIK
ncbi:MAG: hypothetical protein WD530_07340 [Vicingaceae bacterium]